MTGANAGRLIWRWGVGGGRAAAVLLAALFCSSGTAHGANAAATGGEKPLVQAKPAAPVAPEQQSAGAPAAPAVATEAGFAGDDLCRVCHQEAAEAYDRTVHAAALADESRPPGQRGCESCHGPGAAHAEAGGGKGVGQLEPFALSRSAPPSRSAPCLRCHGDNRALFRARSSRHAVAGVACTDCHGGHRAPAEPLLRAARPELCYRCHLQARAEFALPERHRVDQGLVGCGDCHDAHGTEDVGGLRPTGNRQCLRCHVEIEGPYVFEHVPTFSEGCTRCHVPHGGSNRHLLLRQQVAQLCYECHTVTPNDHVQPSYRDCTRCHTAIHGSNFDARLLEP
jgi:DmsE family decaheme c-type cytochrome